jgi:hypothetical protein
MIHYNLWDTFVLHHGLAPGIEPALQKRILQNLMDSRGNDIR